MDEVWLGENVGVDHVVVEVILLGRHAARRWIEGERERSIEDGRRMEKFEAKKEEEYGVRSDEGYWMPTEIERLEDGEGWKFRETQGGTISDTVRIERVEVPYRRRLARSDDGGQDE